MTRVGRRSATSEGSIRVLRRRLRQHPLVSSFSTPPPGSISKPSANSKSRALRTRKERVIDMLSTPLPTSRRLSMLYDADPLRREKQQEKLRLQSVPHVRQRAGLQLLSHLGDR
jgi:hypothetical protein